MISEISDDCRARLTSNPVSLDPDLRYRMIAVEPAPDLTHFLESDS